MATFNAVEAWSRNVLCVCVVLVVCVCGGGARMLEGYGSHVPACQGSGLASC